jgi:hypothetical protein
MSGALKIKYKTNFITKRTFRIPLTLRDERTLKKAEISVNELAFYLYQQYHYENSRAKQIGQK